MSYLARLVQQTGLEVSAPMARVPVQGVLPDTPADAVEGIEEINLEVPASAPAAGEPDIPPIPTTILAAEEEMSAVRPTFASDFPIPADEPPPEPEVEPAVSEVVRVVAQPPEAEGAERKSTTAESKHQIQREITRHKTLRQVVEWVSTNEGAAEETTPELTVHVPAETTRPSVERPVAESPWTDTGSEPAARQIGLKTDPNAIPPGPPTVEVIERAEPTIPESALEPEPVEERVDISIGAINVTVETPAQPAPPPPSTVPVAPTTAPQAPVSRQSKFSTTSDRLRRRFIRPEGA